jgi:hypothetical protein
MWSNAAPDQIWSLCIKYKNGWQVIALGKLNSLRKEETGVLFFSIRV